jgi:hypothetical protein
MNFPQSRTSVLTLFVAIAGASGLSGQTATISGTVTDMSGAAAPTATVSVKNVGTGAAQSVSSDTLGRYNVPDLPIGEYDVQASKAGFQTVIHKGITLTVGATGVVDFTLPVGTAQQTVTVESQVSEVETTSTALANLVEPTQMRELPLNGRNFEDLLNLAPGVVPLPPPAGVFSTFYGNQENYAVAGSRPEGQVFLLDNTNIADFFNHATGSGALGSSLGVESIAEFQTLINTYSGQYSGNGVVVNAVTKSGTNAFHGSAYEFLRNSKLDARNFFDTSNPGGGPPPFRRNQFGGSLGGPLKRDKAFFFVNYEGVRQLLGASSILTVPDANAHNGDLPCALAPAVACNSATGLAHIGVSSNVASTLALYPLPTTLLPGTGEGQLTSVANKVSSEDYFLARFDYSFSDKDSLFARVVSDRATFANPTPSSLIPLWPESDLSRNTYATVEEKRVFTPTLINLARVSFVRPAEQQFSSSSVPATEFFPGRPDGAVGVGGLSGLGANGFLPVGLYENKFTEADDVLWTKGSHNMRFGVSSGRIQDNTYQSLFLGGSWSFSSLASFLQGKAATVLGPKLGASDGYKDFRTTVLMPYFQDDWKVSSRLTLNLGLNWDWSTNPVEIRHAMTALVNTPFGPYTPVTHPFASNPSNKNFNPRIGLAWDPFKDHKTSVRAGFGIFHDLVLARLYAGGYWLNPPYQTSIQLNPSYPTPFATGGINPPPTVSQMQGMDYHFNTTPYMAQYNFNIQRDLGGGNILTVGYVGAAGVHLVVGWDTNHPIPRIGTDGNPVWGTYAPGSTTVTPLPRVNPAFSYITAKEPWGHSDYNSLEVSFNRRLKNNWQMQFSYTYAKSIDDGSTSSSLEGAGLDFSNPINAAADRGRSGFDRTQSFRASTVYILPFHGNRLADGWQLSGIFTALSGAPFSVSPSFDPTGMSDLSVRRPNLVAGRSPNPIVGNVHLWFDPTAFTMQPLGENGNLGRDTLVGPGFWQADIALNKNTRITERLSAQFRAELFNIFNHPDFGLPNAGVFLLQPNGTTTISPTAGQITGTTNTPRQIQFGLKLLF